MSETITITAFEDNYDLSLDDCHSFDIDLGSIQTPVYYTNYTPPMGYNEYEEYLHVQLSSNCNDPYEISMEQFTKLVEASEAYDQYRNEYITVSVDNDSELGKIILSYSEYAETQNDDAEARYNKAMKVIE